MNFENLPPQWPTIPLTDNDHIADVLDIFVDVRARLGGCLLILVCDEQHRPLQPLLIDEVDEVPAADYRDVLGPIAATISAANPRASVLCALGRADRLHVTAHDQAWRRILEDTFAGHAQFLGMHLITLDGAIPIARLESAA
ncbi:MAG: hypothetical protein WCF36_00850 [Candidatus Nanopelagicales bacterium]